MAGISTPFAHARYSDGADGPMLEAGPQGQYAGVQPGAASRRLSSLMLDDCFDRIIPSCPSTDNFLNIATNNLATNGGGAPAQPACMPSLDPCRSLELMGSAASLDLSWLGEGPGQAAGGHALDLHRAASAAELIMGPEQMQNHCLPAPPPLVCTSASSDPFGPHRGATTNQQFSSQHAHQPQDCPTAGSPDYAGPVCIQQPPTPLLDPRTSGGGDPNAAAHLAVLRQQLAMQHAIAAGVIPTSDPATSSINWAHSGRGGAGGLTFGDMSRRAGGGSANNNLAAMGQPSVNSAQHTPQAGAGFYPMQLPGHGGPSATRAHSNADAMALWAQQNALMQALSSSDVGAALHAVSAGLGGGGAFGMPHNGGSIPVVCPVQVQFRTAPALRVAIINPIRLSQRPHSEDQSTVRRQT